ncbi:hypothetical protein IAU59_004794 [Kwoniella sp. CBS 9459]
MSRPIGLRRPSRPPPMKHDLSPSHQSQSQESTQQPSIEIKPSTVALAQPFRPPSRAQTEPPAPATPGNRAIASSSSDRAIGQTSSESAIGSSFEETGDSGLEWTQQQLEKNQQVEARRVEAGHDAEDEGLEAIREASEGVITSPEVAAQASGPKWVSETPGPSRPSTPLTEGDQLDESVPQEEAAIDGLEATEVEDPPSIPSPSVSPRLPTSPVTRHHLPVPPSVPAKVSPRKNLSPMTNFSPKFTSNGNLPSHTLNSPSRAAGSRTSLGFKRKKRENAAEIEDSFGQDPIIRVNPLERINGLMRKHSEAHADPTNGAANTAGGNGHDDAEDSAEQSGETGDSSQGVINGTTRSPGRSEHPSTEGSLSLHGKAVASPHKSVSERGSAEEDENEAINWEQTIPSVSGRGRNPASVDRDEPTSPSPALPIQRRPSTGTPSPPGSPVNGRTHFRQFANSGSTSSPKIGYSGALFSSQAFSNDFDDATQTQDSQLFQPTQMVRQPTSPARSRTRSASHPQLELEATQPDTQPHPAEAGLTENVDGGNEVENQALNLGIQQANSAVPRPAISRIPSVASTTTSSRVEVPAHRQLQRRSRADDGSTVSPFTAHVPQFPQRNGIAPTRPGHLQVRQSEILHPVIGSSPFKKTSPPRRSSEPPLLQETMQESSSDPPIPILPPNGVRREAVLTPPSSPRPAFFHSTPPQLTSSPAPASPRPALNIRPALEETITDGPSLPAPPPVKPSPVKQYLGPSKRRRILNSPSPPVPQRQPEGSDPESSATPEDLEDHTYQPTASVSKANQLGPSGGAVPTVQNIGQKRKRGISPSSPLSNPPGSEDESSSAPEDPADNTYQPSLMLKVKGISGKDKGKSREGSTKASSRASSPARHKKKSKLNARVIRQSTPLSSVASPGSMPAAAPEPPMNPNRVLALYSPHYYPAKIIGIGKAGQTYSIEFDDGDTKSNVPMHHMRQLILRKGESLQASRRSDNLPASFEVAEDWDGNEAGVKCQSGKKRLGRVPLDRIAVKKALIASDFGDRLFPGVNLTINGLTGTIGERLAVREARASVPRSPVKQRLQAPTIPSSRSRRSPSLTVNDSVIFDGMCFLLTKGEGTTQLEGIAPNIRDHGGKCVDKWPELFDQASPGHCAFAKELPGIPFVIPTGEQLVMTVKLMVALAKGIPVLSPKFIEESIAAQELLDWRAYLISPGFSQHTGHYASQCVDPFWGGPGWNPREAVPLRRPFKSKKVLFVQPSTKDFVTMLKELVPVCFYLMSVEEFQAVANIKANHATMQDDKWDYVLFETREKDVPAVLTDAENLCDMHWLKQCLITGSALPPSVTVNQT